MTKIEHEIKIKSNLNDVYQALTTLDGLKSWHSAQMEGESKLNGQLITKGRDKPTFVWKIIALTNNSDVKWECVEGPGDSPGTQVEFNLIERDDGYIDVECIHDGWSKTDDNFTKCNTLWGMLLYHLQQYAETGIANPTFN